MPLTKLADLPTAVLAIVESAAEAHACNPADLLSPSRHRHIVRARDEAAHRLYHLPSRPSLLTIARWLNRDSSSVLTMIRREERKRGSEAKVRVD